MKKSSLVFVLLFSFLLKGYSAYLVNIPQEVKQPDGTILHCLASGDEFYSWLHDSLGYTIVQHPQTGYYVYALSGTEGNIVASNYVAGIADPVALGLQVNVRIAGELIEAKRAAFEAATPPKRQLKAGSNKGTLNNIVIFIRFADENTFTKNFIYMDTMFNDSSSRSANSMYNFFRLASYGQLYILSHFFPAPSGNVILSYQDIYNRSYYQPYDATNNPDGFTSSERTTREHALLVRAVQYVASSIPPGLDLDYDGDGYVDNVIFMVNGNAIAGGDILWAHRWSLYTQTVYINGKQVYDYNLNLANINGNTTSAGVITHEMNHTLGAPDLYRYYASGDPVGSWDLMGSTNYTKGQGLGAYMKSRYGKWIPGLPVITDPGTYTLYPINDSTMSYDGQKPLGYRINLPNVPNEYLVLEYRKINEMTFENSLPGSGIVMYRINQTISANGNRNGPPDEVYIFRPNGTTTVNGTLSSAHFSANVNRTSFDEETNPYPFLCDGTIIKDITISNITTAGDSIQFTYTPQGEYWSVNKNITFNSNGGIDNISVLTNTSWEITGLDTSWLKMSLLSGDSGTFNIQVSTRMPNTLQVPKSCTLTVNYGLNSKQKTLSISQGIAPLTSCQEVSNIYAKDTLVGYNFQQHGITAVAEYFSDNGIQVLDSISFYFGNINPVESGDNTLKLDICVSNAGMAPGTILSSQTIDLANLKPNQWNTIKLLDPVVPTRGFTVGYSFTVSDPDFLGINVSKNASLRVGAFNGTMVVKQSNGQWKKSSETTFPEINNYSLATKVYLCPPSPATDTLLVNGMPSSMTISMSYDSNVQESLDITSNTSWEVMRIPEGYSISQENGTGDARITITTLNKSMVSKHSVYFYVRSGSLVRRIIIERASHPLIPSNRMVEFNYDGTDSASLYILATGTDWKAQTNCNWIWLPKDSGTAGNQRFVIYPTGANNTDDAFEGCVDIVSSTLNESVCITVRQNSFLGITQPNSSVFSIYPNPANSKLWVKSDNVSIHGIAVYDIIGKELLSVPNVNDVQTVLDISTLTQGIYILKIKSEQGEQVRKFIKD